MNQLDMQTNISFSITVGLKQKLMQEAQQHDRSVSSIVRGILDAYFEDEEALNDAEITNVVVDEPKVIEEQESIRLE